MKKTLAHTAWECKYHVVWIPKNRRKIVYGSLKRDIGKIIRKLCEYKQIEVVEGTACADHIHLCLSIPPKYAVSAIVGYLKGKSTMILFEKYSHLRRNFRGHQFWARGYYVKGGSRLAPPVECQQPAFIWYFWRIPGYTVNDRFVE